MDQGKWRIQDAICLMTELRLIAKMMEISRFLLAIVFIMPYYEDDYFLLSEVLS